MGARGLVQGDALFQRRHVAAGAVALGQRADAGVDGGDIAGLGHGETAGGLADIGVHRGGKSIAEIAGDGLGFTVGRGGRCGSSKRRKSQRGEEQGFVIKL